MVCFKLWGGLDLSGGLCSHAGVSGLALKGNLPCETISAVFTEFFEFHCQELHLQVSL